MGNVSMTSPNRSNSSNQTRPTPHTSADATQNVRQYFCHKCNVTIDHVEGDFLCPRCHTGFLELVETPEPGYDQVNAMDLNDFLARVAFPVMMGASQQVGGGTRNRELGARSVSEGGSSGDNTSATSGGEQMQGQEQNFVQGFLQQIIQNLSNGGAFEVHYVQPGGNETRAGGPSGAAGFPFFPMFQLHGNPGDYAWGPGALDAIVTQLLNQIEGGPPPLTAEQIRNLPTVTISQEHCDRHVQCAVCMEDFKLHEHVKQLPCKHMYHDACINPWLERHNTCPVCRNSAAPGSSPSDSSNPSSGRGNSASAAPQMDPLDEYD